MRRVLWLGLRIQSASKLKVALLSSLLALSITVFLVVSELSDLSTEQLEDAIASDSGETGTYAVSIGPGLGVALDDVRETLLASGDLFRTPGTQFAEVLPAIASECPPFDALGEPTMIVLYEASGSPVALPFGENLPPGSELCYSGQKVPETAAYFPTAVEQTAWGPVLFISREYRDVVALASVDPIEFRVRVVTGHGGDELDRVHEATVHALETHGDRQAVDVRSIVTVVRTDDGQATRAASQSVKIVYGAIGWGVLFLGAIAVLVAEMIVVRQRTWFFGLTRALGGRRRHVAVLVLVDVGTVVLGGMLAALALSFVAQPLVAQFVHTAFQADATLLSLRRLPSLLIGGMLVVAVAAIPPALRAVREQPINVLEQRQP